MAQMALAYVANTNNLLLSDVKETINDTPLVGQTVTVTIKKGADEVSGEAWPLVMTSLGAGNYVVALSASLSLEDGEEYTAIIDINASDTNYERIAHWEFPFIAGIRTGES